eukprot:15334143-Heterocapsa_arctica.AAC.1
MLSCDCGLAQDKRLRVMIAQLRQMLHNPLTTVRWIDTLLMLADALTKLEAERELILTVARTNK